MKKKEKQKLDVAIFVQHIDGKTFFLDTEGHISSPSDPENFLTDVADNGKGHIFWFAAKGVKEITSISCTGGTQITKNMHNNSDNSCWSAEIIESKNGSIEEYSVTYVTEDGVAVPVDPRMRSRGDDD